MKVYARILFKNIVMSVSMAIYCVKNDNNMFTNDWAIFETMIVASSDRVVIMAHALKHIK